jgi:Zn-dependent peptidase ImmA (M78 family)
MRQVADKIQASGMDLGKLSSESGIPLARLQGFLGQDEPTLSELRKLASALKLKLSDFVTNNEARDRAQFLFRQTISTTKKVPKTAFIDNYSRKIAYSLELLGNSWSGHKWISDLKIENATFEEAERSAEAFREMFLEGDLISPLFHLPTTAIEKLRVLLFVIPERFVDGASAVVNGFPFVFVSPRFAPRMLFTLAHEVGHLITHRGSTEEYAFLDLEGETGKIRRSGQKWEYFADVFASCLLLPPAGVGIALKKIRELVKATDDNIGDIELLYLSRIFGVSFQVAAVRCEDLGLLPRGGAVSIYEKLVKAHKSPERRAEEVNLPPRPKIEFPAVPKQLLDAAVDKIRTGEISIGRASAALNLSISKVMSRHAETTHWN